MKSKYMTLAIFAWLFVPNPAPAAEPNTLLEYEFSGDPNLVKGVNDKLLSAKLSIIEFGATVPKEGVHCIRFGKEGSHRVRYVCAPSEEPVYREMTRYYFAAVSPKSPLGDIALTISSVPTFSCSAGGCRNAAHPGRQPCIWVYDNLMRLKCRHDPYDANHECN